MNTVLGTAIATTPDNTPAQGSQEKPVAKKASVNKPVAKKAPTKKTAVKRPAASKLPVQKTESTVVKSIAVKADASAQKIKPKKQKMVRDSFTMPESEYQTLSDLKKTCLKQGIAVKKSELLRIGVATLKSMTAKQIETARNKLEKIAAGRPKKD
jgi:hypothetical protein